MEIPITDDAGDKIGYFRPWLINTWRKSSSRNQNLRTNWKWLLNKDAHPSIGYRGHPIFPNLCQGCTIPCQSLAQGSARKAGGRRGRTRNWFSSSMVEWKLTRKGRPITESRKTGICASKKTGHETSTKKWIPRRKNLEVLCSKKKRKKKQRFGVKILCSISHSRLDKVLPLSAS